MPVQIMSPSWPQPVPAVQPAAISSCVHILAPGTEAQTLTAVSQVASWMQPWASAAALPLNIESDHTVSPDPAGQFIKFLVISVSEQHRTCAWESGAWSVMKTGWSVMKTG